MKILAKLSYVVAVIWMGMGFYRLYVYENPESYLFESKNAWVGGDSYNFIINGTHATAFFILCLTFIVIGLGMEIVARKNEQTTLLKKIAGIEEVEETTVGEKENTAIGKGEE